MEFGEALTRWSVRVAMAAYAASLALRLAGVKRRGGFIPARALWVAGCMAFLIHVGAAFYFFHGGSHAAAYAHTARRTQEVVGLDWGGGLYFNYLFAAVWTLDALWWLIDREGYDVRPRLIAIAGHAFLLFMAFNAVVVFGPPTTRAAGIGACALLVAVAWAAKDKTNDEVGIMNDE